MIAKTVTVQIDMAEESHPIAFMVQKASQYKSRIYFEMGNKKINAKSIMGMMTLQMEKGANLKVTAEGADEAEAVKEITDYLTMM